MFKNYLLVTFRTLLKNKIFTLINILGLGVALLVCIVAFFNHMFNYEFDRTHKNFNEIYRITSFRDMQGREQEYGIVPATLGLEIKKDIPGIERAARLMRTGSPVKIGDNVFPAQVSFIDPEFLDIFTFPLIYGDKKVITGQGNVLVSETMSKTLFGNEFPVGKSISVVNDQNKEFTFVIGVVEDFYVTGLWGEIEPTMLRLSRSDKYYNMAVRANPKDLPGVLEMIGRKWKTQGTNLIFGGRLQEDTMQEEKDINNSIMKVNIFLAIVAILLSLIGMFNLVSLDIIRRTKEVGIRKIQGASVSVIILLISKKFLIILLIASILGCAGGYYLSVSLMDSIWDYFVNIGAGLLLSAALIMIIATILTLAIRITRAAMKNPADSLRYE